MNWQQRMEAAIDYVERNLEGELDCEKAAAEANCSLFHFMRMFDVVTGMTLSEYARRRRLSLAALSLAGGGASVIDTALRYGYESPDAFAKAFKREFGITPSEAKEPGARIRAWPRLAFSVVLKGDRPMDMRFEEKEAFSMTGYSIRVSADQEENFRTIPGFWNAVLTDGRCAALEKAMPRPTRMGVMGVCACDMDPKEKTFTYLIAIETPKPGSPEAKAVPRECVELKAPKATWAVFECRGPLPGSIQTVWKRIFQEWFPTSGYEHGDGPELEVYSPEGSPVDPDYYSEIWIPVRKAK